jgi:hypothetical protein
LIAWWLLASAVHAQTLPIDRIKMPPGFVIESRRWCRVRAR